jgi:hypothetical protein
LIRPKRAWRESAPRRDAKGIQEQRQVPATKLAGSLLVSDTYGGQLLEQQGEVVHFEVGTQGARSLGTLEQLHVEILRLPTVPLQLLRGAEGARQAQRQRAGVGVDDAAHDGRQRVMPGGAIVRPTFLVDGFVRGTWSLEGTTLLVSPFRPLSEADTAALLEEAERLLDFVAPDAEATEVRFVGCC